MAKRVTDFRVRAAILNVLKLQDGDPLADAPLLDAVNALVGNGVDLTQLRDCMELHHNDAFVRSERVEELDLDGWIITKKGINHSRIK